jgi:hypothetical protein
MNTKFNVCVYIYIYVLFYLYKEYASYIHISRGYVKHKRLRTTGLNRYKSVSSEEAKGRTEL